MQKGVILLSLEKASKYLDKREKVKAILLSILLLISSLLDVGGLASIVPVMMAASTPAIIKENRYFSAIYNLFGFTTINSFLVFLIVAIFIFFLVKNIFTIWVNLLQVKFSASIAIKIVKNQFDKYMNLPYWYFNNEGSAKLINNVGSIPQMFVSGIIRTLFNIFSEVTIMFVIVLGILIYEPILFTILMVVLLPSALLTYRLLKKRSERIGQEINKSRPEAYSILANTFNGLVELKLADKLKKFKERYISNQEFVQALEAKSYLYSLVPIKIIEMVSILGVVTIFLYSIFFSDSPNSIISLIGLFAAAAYRLMPSVNRLLMSMITIQTNYFTIAELDLFKEYSIEHSLKTEPTELIFDKEIHIKNLSFTFPSSEKPVLQNIDFKIKKGEKVGFIGTSGSGKTTLMNVLLRFYVEQQGKILIDGEPLNENNKSAWYSIVGYVKQDTFLMESSIKNNITLFDEIIDEKKLNYALEKASLKDFINTLPEGLNTSIGERGSRLSGGQKQRIGIARALYKNTKVLILDEATSALDTVTEREVSEAITNLSNTNITILIIAHRITTLRDCNRIFEMKDGEIIGERTYSEVLKSVI